MSGAETRVLARPDGVASVPTPVQQARWDERARRWRDPARYARLAAVAVVLLVPITVPSFQAMDLALKIAVFATLVASYDVLIGYTGIVSFGHAMFFGLGAYAVGLSLGKFGAATYGHLALGFAVGIALAAVLSFVIGAFSLRVKAIFFAMITLAFAEFALILAVQLSQFTGGEDGVSPRLPGVFAVAYAGSLLGVPVTGRGAAYYAIVTVCVVLFLAMGRFVRSPLGRALQAIRDNELRAEALGYRTFVLQSVATSFASVVATILGGCYVMWVRYVNPESALGINIMLDILLMVIIGGIGTLYGSIVGAAILLTAQTLLPNLRAVGAALFPGSEIVQRLTDRWLLYFGILFILVVFFFPRGVLGSLSARRRRTA
jgi:branched-chain amino acid transport system permease protein